MVKTSVVLTDQNRLQMLRNLWKLQRVSVMVDKHLILLSSFNDVAYLSEF